MDCSSAIYQGSAEVIVSVWSKEWDMINKWLAEHHPELSDPARTPVGVILEQMQKHNNE